MFSRIVIESLAIRRRCRYAMDTEIGEANRRFRKRDYAGCLKILNDQFVRKGGVERWNRESRITSVWCATRR